MDELMIKVTVILVNGKWVEESYLLEGGDGIGLFSPIGGGQR